MPPGILPRLDDVIGSIHVGGICSVDLMPALRLELAGYGVLRCCAQ